MLRSRIHIPPAGGENTGYKKESPKGDLELLRPQPEFGLQAFSDR